MKIIESALESTNGFILSFIRNTTNGWWELEIGLPKSWVYDANNDIGCDIIDQNDVGRLIKIFPKNNDIVIDDLISFVEIIIDTNKRIGEKEKEFNDRMNEMKGLLEKEAKKFYEELDELKENSFKNINENFVRALHPEGDVKKETRGRKPKSQTVSGDTVTNIETTTPAIRIDQSRST